MFCKGALYFLPLVEILHNSTNAKEQKNLTSQSIPSKNSVKVSFVTSGTQKNYKKGIGFSVFAP